MSVTSQFVRGLGFRSAYYMPSTRSSDKLLTIHPRLAALGRSFGSSGEKKMSLLGYFFKRLFPSNVNLFSKVVAYPRPVGTGLYKDVRIFLIEGTYLCGTVKRQTTTCDHDRNLNSEEVKPEVQVRTDKVDVTLYKQAKLEFEKERRMFVKELILISNFLDFLNKNSNQFTASQVQVLEELDILIKYIPSLHRDIYKRTLMLSERELTWEETQPIWSNKLERYFKFIKTYMQVYKDNSLESITTPLAHSNMFQFEFGFILRIAKLQNLLGATNADFLKEFRKELKPVLRHAVYHLYDESAIVMGMESAYTGIPKDPIACYEEGLPFPYGEL